MRVRPLGVAILGWLHLLGGLLMLAPLTMFALDSSPAENSLRQLGVSPWIFVTGVVLLGLLGFLSGWGLLAGKKWGWWLALFYYIYSVIRNSYALYLIPDLAERIGGPQRGVGYYQFKYACRIVIALLILSYLFRDPVRLYFKSESTSKLKALGTVVSVCIALWLAMNGAPLLTAD